MLVRVVVSAISSGTEVALRNGADYVFAPFAPDFVEKVMKTTNGGVHVAIEVTDS